MGGKGFEGRTSRHRKRTAVDWRIQISREKMIKKKKNKVVSAVWTPNFKRIMRNMRTQPKENVQVDALKSANICRQFYKRNTDCAQ